MARFNPRAHAGRDRRRTGRVQLLTGFNPRAHAGRDVFSKFRPRLRQMFQSTRPRGARLCRPGGCRHRRKVSIHAPTRGATDFQRPAGPSRLVSIHAPTRGATIPFVMSVATSLFQSTRPRGARPLSATSPDIAGCFNPRAHAGRDCSVVRSFPLASVSIHAPTRGATLPQSQMLTEPQGFNPRAHAGRDKSA
mgnify:CR=1 FL=1